MILLVLRKTGLRLYSLPRVVALPLFYLLASTVTGQETVRGALLIQLQTGIAPEQLVSKLHRAPGGNQWVLSGRVSDMLQVWQLVHPGSDREEDAAMLSWLKRQPEVRIAQYDHLLERRHLHTNSLWPDDPFIGAQWQYANNGQMGGLPGADLAAEAAWNISTGGLTAAGDTIVVAIIDGGVAPHPDLAGNMWINYSETPGDGLDNDGNGYIDDYRGWNVYQQNDAITGIGITHGTPIAGIIGASGNNGIGVSGVNWKVKNLFVAGKGQESVLLAAFDYVWKARRRYNATNGAEGAFVVALNCSWGVDYGQPGNAPLWCAAFDSLGKEGILTVAATANLDLDVDVAGDLPTACPSEYLVSVTSLDNKDQKAQGAAWGAVSIDLGAYGEMVYTLSGADGYGYQEGTSFAAPHVAGAIALLYASPCDNLAALAGYAPSVAALWVKDFLLNKVRPNAALSEITLSGGRLDLYELLSGYEEQCADCPHPYAPTAAPAGPDSVWISWTGVPAIQSVNLRWRPVGASSWNFFPGVTAPVLLSGLSACSDFEFSLRANCAGGQGSAWSDPVVFRTEGCCLPPEALVADVIMNHSAALHWLAVGVAQEYVLQIRPEGVADWVSYTLDTNTTLLTGLLPCILYEGRVQSRCDTGLTDFSPSLFFRTPGCGACIDLQYCEAEGGQANDEWIASVAIGDWQLSSGGQIGYEDFSGTEGAVLTLMPGEMLPLTLTPGYAGWTYKEFFRIYIDYNSDGDFNDPDELAFDPGFAVSEPVTGILNVPSFSGSGWVRMRVMMKFKGLFNNPPEPCEKFEYGQVEDYCVQLQPPLNQQHSAGSSMETIMLYPQPAREMVVLQTPSDIQGELDVKISDASGRLHLAYTLTTDAAHKATLPTKQLQPGLYWLQLTDGRRYYRRKLLIQ